MKDCPTCSRPYLWVGDYRQVQLLKVDLITPTYVKGRSFGRRASASVMEQIRQELEPQLMDPNFVKPSGIRFRDFYHTEPEGFALIYEVRIKKAVNGDVEISAQESYLDKTDEVLRDLNSQETQEYLQGLKTLEGRVVPVKRVLPQWPNFELELGRWGNGLIFTKFSAKYEPEYDRKNPKKIRPTLVFTKLAQHDPHTQQDISLEYVVRDATEGTQAKIDLTKIAQLDLIVLTGKEG